MARKKATVSVVAAPGKEKPKQQTFEGDGFPKPIPKEAQRVIDAFMEAKRKAADAKAVFNTARDNVISTMIEFGITRAKIDDGEKYLELDTTQAVKVKTAKKPGESDEDDDSGEE